MNKIENHPTRINNIAAIHIHHLTQLAMHAGIVHLGVNNSDVDVVLLLDLKELSQQIRSTFRLTID